MANIKTTKKVKNIITLKNIQKSFDNQLVLHNINLTIKQGEFITILGPSGCGKTTMLRLIGGFEQPTNGVVTIDGTNMNGMPAHKRPVNTVFQSYALFPHLSVFDNIAFGLKIAKVEKEEIKTRVGEVLKLVGLSGYEKRNIEAMSGGQRQRVALARAIINKPKVLLLDEPLSALDRKLRENMQNELRDIQETLGITFVFVTHDQDEALSMSDRIVVMSEGSIQQIGTPKEIYDEPANMFVAEFIGHSNIIADAAWVGKGKVTFDNIEFNTTDSGFKTGEVVDVIIRPEDIDLVKKGTGLVTGKVIDSKYKGLHYEVKFQSKGRMWTIHTTDAPKGKLLDIKWELEDIHTMEKEEWDDSIEKV